MSGKWEELTDQFDALSETGDTYRLLVYTTMIDARTMSDPNAAPLRGLDTVRTTEGHHCSRIDDDTWEIVGLGVRVVRTR